MPNGNVAGEIGACIDDARAAAWPAAAGNAQRDHDATRGLAISAGRP
jgi:hypothetical protein